VSQKIQPTGLHSDYWREADSEKRFHRDSRRGSMDTWKSRKKNAYDNGFWRWRRTDTGRDDGVIVEAGFEGDKTLASMMPIIDLTGT